MSAILERNLRPGRVAWPIIEKIPKDFWAYISEQLITRRPSRPKEVLSMLSFLREILKDIEVEIRHTLKTVRENLKKEGLWLVISYRACHRPTCSTCLSRYPSHIAFRLEYMEGGRKKVKYIKMRDIKDLFRDYGMDESQIELLFNCINLRTNLLMLYNLLLLHFERFGWVIMR